jgi:carboxylesterase type B
VQFAKTGNPNAGNVPDWPAFDEQADQYLDLGQTIRLRPVSQRVHILAQIMRQVLAESDTRSPAH